MEFGRSFVGNIEYEYLADGARRLSLRNWRRSRAQEEEIGPPDSREPARVITMAWGERYVGDLLEVTVPALLAPGNLPALAGEFECEFVVVTETRFFDRFMRSVSIHGLLRFADLRLVPIDDLLSPWYGITLTYALVRGFADLGSAMTDTHLIFLNADFIVADGSYRKLAQVINDTVFSFGELAYQEFETSKYLTEVPGNERLQGRARRRRHADRRRWP